jgi:hypothetical protein
VTDRTRREFLKRAGACGVTTAMAGMGAFGCRAPVPTGSAAQHPFGYPDGGLDVERTRARGYEGFQGIALADGTKHAGCGFGAFNAIIGGLAEKVGGPYTAIPTQMMDWAGAGVAGFGSLCGTLSGACAAIGLICDAQHARAFVSDLMTWYAETALPTNLLAPTGDLPQSKAGSSLCHVSLTRWCRTSGFASGSPERAERCARLAGDVSAKAVELLNHGALGLERPGEKTVCHTCHYMGPNFQAGQFTHGAEDCLTCHVDLRGKPVGPTGHAKG